MKKKVMIIAVTAALAGCTDSETDNSSAHDSAAEKNSAKSSCVAGYIQKPCELLTAKLIKQHYPSLPADAEQQVVTQLHSCAYTWPGNGRTKSMKMSGRKFDVPVNNEIGIKWIKKKDIKTALQTFKQSYRTLSDEEKAQAVKSMQKTIDQKTSGMSQDQKAVVSGMSKGFLNNMKFQAIDNIGTAAAWGGTMGPSYASLKVLDGDTEFEISANISDDEAENMKLASAVAKSVIASCQ